MRKSDPNYARNHHAFAKGVLASLAAQEALGKPVTPEQKLIRDLAQRLERVAEQCAKRAEIVRTLQARIAKVK